MKKLLFIALLMLALVVTAVACSDDKPADTTIGETTAAPAPGETTVEPDADTTAEPAPETTVAPAPETTEAPEETTKEVTTEEVTTEEVTTADPADPIGVYEADKISTIVGGDPSNITQDCVSLEDGYLHVVPIGADPYWYPFANVKGARYVSIRYRTDATGADIQMYIGSTGAGPSNDDSMLRQPVVADGEWHLAIFDTQEIIDKGLYDGSTVSYFRFDALEAGYKLDENGEKYYIEGTETWARYTLPENCYIDVEYIAFFNTAEYAQAYDFEQHKAPMWDADKAVIKHQSFDELDKYAAGAKVEGCFTPGQSSGWGKVIDLADFSVDALRYWGWIAFMGEQGQFGYQINGGTPVYNAEWAHVGGDHEVIVGEAGKVGADGGTRMQIMISLAGLVGTNNIRVLYKTADGVEVCLNEFTVNLPARAPFEVPEHTEETIDLGKRGNGGPFSGMDKKKFGQRFNIGENFLKTIIIKDMAAYTQPVNTWAFRIWAWDTDYATTTATEPIYVLTGENHPDNTTFTVADLATYGITGDFFYEVEYVSGDKGFTGWKAEEYVAEGVQTYVAGELVEGTYTSSLIVGVATPDTPDEPETPVVENVVIDLSTIEGYRAENPYGYNGPILNIGYDNVYLVGEFDLNQYAQIIIEYSYDGDTVLDKPVIEEWTNCDRAPIIGFTALNKCFGYANVTNQDAIDLGVYTDLVYTPGCWAAATRTATIEIPENIGYNGPCYVSAYNPWNREIAIASITLVPRA